MHIAHIARRTCVRVMKEALALQSQGHKVELFSQCAFYEAEELDGIHAFFTPEQLQKTIKSSQADIFHVHNEADWLVKVVKEASGGRPVVFDCHDLNSLSDDLSEPLQDEKDAFGYADGLVHVSYGHKAECEKRHGNSKPAMVLPSLVNQRHVPPASMLSEPNWKAICYQGGLSVDQSITPMPETKRADGATRIFVQYRALHPVVRAFSSQGYNFYLFSAEMQPMEEMSYFNAGGIMVQPILYPIMLKAIRNFAFGFCGAPYPFVLMLTALPNKFFEYISQGVVPVIYNSDETAQYARQFGVGIVLNSLENLPAQLECAPEIRVNIMAQRERMVMEGFIHYLIAFYETLLNGRAEPQKEERLYGNS